MKADHTPGRRRSGRSGSPEVFGPRLATVTKHLPPGSKCVIVPLEGDKFALIDPEDKKRVSKLNWEAIDTGQTYYASAWDPRRKASVSLHRFVLRLPSSLPLVRHENDRAWDCRKKNLQIDDSVGIASGRPKQRGQSSRFIGVSRYGSKWRARVFINGKVSYSKSFYSEIGAAICRDWAAARLHGKRARLNFPDGPPDPLGSLWGDE
jgi:hypothetical protein